MGPWENLMYSSLWYTTIKIEWNEAAEMKLMEALPSPTAIQNGAKKIVNLYLIKRNGPKSHILWEGHKKLRPTLYLSD